MAGYPAEYGYETQMLIGYVATCRSSNTPHWMEGLVVRLNECLAFIGDPVRMVWDDENDWIVIEDNETYHDAIDKTHQSTDNSSVTVDADGG